MEKTGFSSEKYLKLQSEHIRSRIEQFGGKLYLEFGGKLFDDYHAARVLPGFRKDNKINLLMELRDKAEIVLAINAADIEKSKMRGDYGISYDADLLRLIDAFRACGLYVGSVVITKWNGQPAAERFKGRLESLGIRVYRHYPIEGYPTEIDRIVSDDGYGRNEYIETERPLVVVTAPGPGSGKMATCLSQVYHDRKRGIEAGYAKFETFPIWNLPLNHPVNAAYEAATADLNDVNMIDPFHLEAYGTVAVNYSRDVDVFPVLDAIFERMEGASPYKSPTDMGVNMAGYCITDDEAVSEAARMEIVRRYFAAECGFLKGTSSAGEVEKLRLIMNKTGVTVSDRPGRAEALELAESTGKPAATVTISDGRVITGKTTELMGSVSSMLLNALKVSAGIDDSVKLIDSSVIEPIQSLKVNHLGSRNPRLHADEILTALSICAVTDPNAALAMDQLSSLSGCEAHSSVILSSVDEGVLKKLGINLTCEPVYETNDLYHK